MTRQEVILIPGWGFNRNILVPVEETLRSEYNVSILDLPTPSSVSIDDRQPLGRNPGEPRRVNHSQYVDNHTQYRYEDGRSLLDDLHIQQAIDGIPDGSIIIGWSLGGLIGGYIAAHYPAKCRKLICICSSPKYIMTEIPNTHAGSVDTNVSSDFSHIAWPGINHRYIDRFIRLGQDNMNKVLESFAELVVKPISDPVIVKNVKDNILGREKFKNNTHSDSVYGEMVIDSYPKNLFDNKLLYYLKVLRDTDLRNEYDRLSVPVLHIFAENDSIVPIDTAEIMEERYHGTNISIKRIYDANHIVFLTNRDGVINIIRTFIH